MESFYLVVLYLLIGVGLQRLSVISESFGAVLNQYVLYVAMPAMILQNVPNLVFSSELLVPAITPWVLLAVSVVLVLLLQRWLGFSREVTGALLILVPLGNTSFLGFPMVTAFYGLENLPYAVVYDQLGSFIMLATYAALIAAIYGNSGDGLHWKSILWRLLTFPSFLALILAFSLYGWTYPSLLQHLVDSLAATLVPVVMVAVGFALRLRIHRDEMVPLFSGLGIKMLLLPLVAFYGWQLLGVEAAALAFQITVFEAAMPPMISAGAVAMMAGLAPRLASSMVGIGLLFGFVTLPAVFWLLN